MKQIIMNIGIFLVFLIIVGNIMCIKGKKAKRKLEGYCSLPEDARAIGWLCIKQYIPDEEQEMFQKLTSCFGQTSFDKVLNLFCDLTTDERDTLISENLHCFEHMEKFGGPHEVLYINTHVCSDHWQHRRQHEWIQN